VHWRRVLSFVLLCAFTIPLSTLAVYVVRDLRERNALHELGIRAAERARALTAFLAEARGRSGVERLGLATLGQDSIVLDPGLVFEVAESLQHGATGPLLIQDYRDPLDATGARWLAAFAPIGQTGYFCALQVRAPKLALTTAVWLGLLLAAVLWALSSTKNRNNVRA
jgi:hypothetical protein